MSRITNADGFNEASARLVMCYERSPEDNPVKCKRCGRENGDIMVLLPEEKYIGYNKIRHRRVRHWTVRVGKKGLCKQCREDIKKNE